MHYKYGYPTYIQSALQIDKHHHHHLKNDVKTPIYQNKMAASAQSRPGLFQNEMPRQMFLVKITKSLETCVAFVKFGFLSNLMLFVLLSWQFYGFPSNSQEHFSCWHYGYPLCEYIPLSRSFPSAFYFFLMLILYDICGKSF